MHDPRKMKLTISYTVILRVCAIFFIMSFRNTTDYWLYLNPRWTRRLPVESSLTAVSHYWDSDYGPRIWSWSWSRWVLLWMRRRVSQPCGWLWRNWHARSSDTHGGALVSKLHSHTSNGDPLIRNFTTQILEEVNQDSFLTFVLSAPLGLKTIFPNSPALDILGRAPWSLQRILRAAQPWKRFISRGPNLTDWWCRLWDGHGRRWWRRGGV